MTTGYCVTCNEHFPVETRIAGKLISAGATMLLGQATGKLPWWGVLLLGAGAAWLGHQLDKEWTEICPSPGCNTALRVLEAALN